jgi:signal peptidase I
VRSSAKSLGTVAAAAVLACAVWLLWPSSLGGRATYVVTHGVSMEPGFHTDDLAILHPSATYGVGDVAAYHSDTLHTVVLHRIHAVNPDGGLVFKGDNNAWLDPDHPVKSQVLGRLWLRIPEGGRYLSLAHSPWVLGTLGALVIGTGSRKAHRRRTRRARRARTRPVIPPGRLPAARTAAAVLAVTAVATSLAVAYLWSLPSTTSVKRTVSIAHVPTVSYGAVAPTGVTYPDGRVHDGQPVYLRLVHQLTVSVDDRLTSTAALGPVTTKVSVRVTLATPGGWTTTLTTLPATTLGARAATVTIDLPAALNLLQAVATETGVNQSGGTVTVVAHLDAVSTLDGRTVDSPTDTTRTFGLDPAALRPVAASSSGIDAAPAATTVTTRTTRAATVDVRGRQVALRPLRAVLSLLAVAAWLLVLGLVPLLRSGEDEVTRAVRVFGKRLVRVSALDPGQRVVAVSNATALLRIADRYERLVMHLPGERTTEFAVHEDGVSYVLTIRDPAEGRRHLWAA